MSSSLYIAVDLGAGSGRVFIAGFDDDSFLLEEVKRFTYPPAENEGRLVWNFQGIFENICAGLKLASERALALNRKVVSIGVDSWGVDYGLIGPNGNLIGDPVCYRDPRTDGMMERVFSLIPRNEIFARTGIQFLQFNTIFQLASEQDRLSQSRMLLIPDLINFFLTGKATCEYTNATTTQLVNAQTGNWDQEIIDLLGFERTLFAEIVPSGTDLGPLKPKLAVDLKLESVKVIAPATHDTGSAVAGLPMKPQEAFISSGTWSLVGVERNEVLINEQVAVNNFTNEGGVYGTFRFLKNVMGLWNLESCRREWDALGTSIDYETLIANVAGIEEHCGLIYPDDERFLNPVSMIQAIDLQMTESGQRCPTDPFQISKIILDSLAFRYASVLSVIEDLTGEKLKGVMIGGGGGRNSYLNQMTANCSGLPVKAGLVEATVTGNLLVQAITSGRFKDLSGARAFVGHNCILQEYKPSNISETLRAQYREIEAAFAGN